MLHEENVKSEEGREEIAAVFKKKTNKKQDVEVKAQWFHTNSEGKWFSDFQPVLL